MKQKAVEQLPRVVVDVGVDGLDVESQPVKRDLLSITDLSADEIEHIIADAVELKREFRAHGRHEPAFAGQTLIMIFEKPSLRTRVSFEIGMTQLGGHTVDLPIAEIGMGVREPLRDVAEVLSRMGAILMARTYRHETIVELARYSRVPVINGLSDLEHPCQTLADLLTMHEYKGALRNLQVAFFGDSENNVAHSLALAAGLLGMHFTACSPLGYWMDPQVAGLARGLAAKSGGTITETESYQDAAVGADVVYTDTWVSMGDEMERDTRLQHLGPFQVTSNTMRAAKRDAILMHDMPAYRGQEVTAEVIDGPQSVMYQQAENRLHAQKAAMLYLVGHSRGARQ